MAMDSKMDFLREVEKALADKVTVADMSGIMTTLSDVLEGYDMRTIRRWEDDTDDCLESYISALSVEGRSQKTIDLYRYIIGRMMDFVKVPTRRITVYHLREYLAAEKARGISDSTLNNNRQIFSAYFNWLQRESLIEKNPTANLGKIKVAKREKQTYSAVEIERLNEKVVLFEYGVRDRAIINFLQTTGCRVSEVSAINRDEIDLKNRECVVHGKGNKDRTVFFSEVTGMLLAQYLDSRTDTDPCLFLGAHKRRLLPGGIRVMLKKVGDKAHVEHVHPHKFRRTFATELNHRGLSAQDIKTLMGHDKMDTTMQYINMNKEDVKSAYRRYA